MGSSVADALLQARAGRVLTVFCDDVPLARRQLRANAEELESMPTLAALEWDEAPSLARELDEICDALADAAASLWPDWYITAEQRFEQTRSPLLDATSLLAEVTRTSLGASSSWLRQAWELCRTGQRPIVRDRPAADQVRQLARALDPTRLVVALSVSANQAPASRVRGLARAAEWLARESEGKALLLVPSSWRGHSELDHVSYGAITLEPTDADVEQQRTPSQARERTTHSNRLATPTKTANPAPTVVVGPIVGKPHPGSDIEQLVHQRIMADAELCDLFQYNQRLTAVGQKYIVDLVWHRGGLVVELDGPEHYGQLAYFKDRDRDYRLYLSGYATLRIPNGEVCVSVDAAVEKIRTMVRHLKSSPSNREQQ